jgi:DNA-binding MltR family transcriptional regulator
MNAILRITLLLSILGLNPNTNFSKADKIEIKFYKGRKQLAYSTTDKNIVDAFKELIVKSKNNPTAICDTTGEIIYLKNNQRLLKVYFSTHATKSKYRHPGIRYNNITSLMTYRAGMDLDEIFYNLNK